MTEKEPINLAKRRRIKDLVPLRFHPRVNWLPSQLRNYAQGSQQNALIRARRNCGEEINIVTIHANPDPGA